MDLSIKLKLDDSGLAGQAQAAAGQISAAAQTAASATGGASKSADDLAAAAKQVAATARDAASALKQQADALEKTAGATKEAARENKEAEQGSKDLSAAVVQARGAMGVFNGTTAMASGSLQGMAGGAVQAASGMRALGASLKTAMDATLVLAVVAAAAALAKAIADARSRAEELQRGIQFGNMRARTEEATSAFAKLCSEMERAAGLQKRLDDAAGSGRRLEQEKQLAQLELERNEALAAGGDADGINKAFDAKKRALEFSFRREDAAATVSGIERDRAANAGERERLSSELDRLEGVWREQSARAMENTTAMSETRLPWRKERYAADAERWGGAASETAKAMDALREQIKSLEAEDEVLASQLEVERGRGEVIDIQERTANLAAQLPEKKKDDVGGIGGGFGSLQTASDRLARIGGFVGGGHERTNEAREQLRIDREKLAVLKNIDENTKNKETGGLA